MEEDENIQIMKAIKRKVPSGYEKEKKEREEEENKNSKKRKKKKTKNKLLLLFNKLIIL